MIIFVLFNTYLIFMMISIFRSNPLVSRGPKNLGTVYVLSFLKCLVLDGGVLKKEPIYPIKGHFPGGNVWGIRASTPIAAAILAHLSYFDLLCCKGRLKKQ